MCTHAEPNTQTVQPVISTFSQEKTNDQMVNPKESILLEARVAEEIRDQQRMPDYLVKLSTGRVALE